MNVKILNIEPYDKECEIDKIKFLPPEQPPVSVVIPYKCGNEFNDIYVCENDEVIVVTGGYSIGHARIAGALHSENDWLVHMDSDAVYPNDYMILVKRYIREFGEEYKIMCARRKGGFGNLIFRNHEHGMVVRKDVFLDRSVKYLNKLSSERSDVGRFFRDAKIIPVDYYHGFTKGEKTAVFAVGVVSACAVVMKFK